MTVGMALFAHKIWECAKKTLPLHTIYRNVHESGFPETEIPVVPIKNAVKKGI